MSRVIRDRAPYLLTVLAVAGLIALWQWASAGDVVHEIVLPTPSVVWESLKELVQEGSFWTALWTTLQEVVLGLTIGCGAGIAMALMCTRYTLVRQVLAPYITAFQAVPKIVLIPLLGIWFGLGSTTAVIIVALITFFPTYISTLTGLGLSAENGLRLLYSLGASRSQAFRMYRIPTALPMVFSGLKTSINYSVTAAVLAEFLGAGEGLGHLVTQATLYLNIPGVYATVIAISALTGIVFVVMETLDRRVIFWRDDFDERAR